MTSSGGACVARSMSFHEATARSSVPWLPTAVHAETDGQETPVNFTLVRLRLSNGSRSTHSSPQ